MKPVWSPGSRRFNRGKASAPLSIFFGFSVSAPQDGKNKKAGLVYNLEDSYGLAKRKKHKKRQKPTFAGFVFFGEELY